MKVSKLIEYLSLHDKDSDLTLYFLDNHNLTNCELETIIETDLGVELTIKEVDWREDNE